MRNAAHALMIEEFDEGFRKEWKRVKKEAWSLEQAGNMEKM